LIYKKIALDNNKGAEDRGERREVKYKIFLKRIINQITSLLTIKKWENC